MAKYFGIFVIIIFLLSCRKDEEIQPLKSYKFTLDSVLTQSGNQSLYKDNNGYFHLKLIENKNQSVHRITGRILVNDKEPLPAEKIEWESNLYWYLKRGDSEKELLINELNNIKLKRQIITDLGLLIKTRRKVLNITQKDLSEMVGITFKSISEIELNQRNPTLDTITKILDVLGYEINFTIKSIN